MMHSGVKWVLSTFALLIVLVSILTLGTAGKKSGDVVTNRAIIIVSDGGGFDPHELSKAMAYYSYLRENGYDDDDIQLLTPEKGTFVDGEPTVQGVTHAFSELIEDDDPNKNVKIYISDHVGSHSEGTYFKFSDGVVYTSTIVGWMDSIICMDMKVMLLGNRSGLTGEEMYRPGRMVMSSMNEVETHGTDMFNITRGLRDPFADMNGDGIVDYNEAFLSEKNRVGWYQSPMIWMELSEGRTSESLLSKTLF